MKLLALHASVESFVEGWTHENVHRGTLQPKGVLYLKRSEGSEKKNSEAYIRLLKIEKSSTWSYLNLSPKDQVSHLLMI